MNLGMKGRLSDSHTDRNSKIFLPNFFSTNFMTDISVLTLYDCEKDLKVDFGNPSVSLHQRLTSAKPVFSEPLRTH